MRPTFVTYLDIAEDLRRKMLHGRYPPGSKIPSYSELARMYDVSLSTVQRAVVVLRYSGIVVGYQGRGVFVTEPRQR